MSKERLEEIKENTIGLVDEFGDFADFVQLPVDDYAHLYKQADRVQELESENRALKEVAKNNQFIGEGCLKQNKRYLEIIEKLYKFDGNVQEHSALADMLCGEILEGEE